VKEDLIVAGWVTAFLIAFVLVYRALSGSNVVL